MNREKRNNLILDVLMLLVLAALVYFGVFVVF